MTQERPGIAEIADRLISHMDRSRRLYVLLIAASLALAAASFAFMGIVLSPGAAPAVGTEYGLGPGGAVGHLDRGVLGAYEGAFEGRLLGGSDGPDGPFYGEFVGEFGGRTSVMSGEFYGSFDGEFDDFHEGLLPGEEFGMYEGAFEGEFYGEFYGMDDPGEFALSLGIETLPGEFDVVYVPEGGYPPTFIASAGEGPPADVTSAVAGFAGVMSAISLLVLYVGLRESMFYSDWAPRFKKYKEQRDAIDRELDPDEAGSRGGQQRDAAGREPGPTPSS